MCNHGATTPKEKEQWLLKPKIIDGRHLHKLHLLDIQNETRRKENKKKKRKEKERTIQGEIKQLFYA
ncbi:hypothetical protein LguiA_024998 [Lonicera macranthoides]